MIKKNKIISLILCIILVIGTTACGSKDNGPKIITAGDSGKNNESLYNPDSTEFSESDESDELNEVVLESTEETVELESNGSIMGVWITEYGDIHQFNEDSTYAGYVAETGENTFGTYTVTDKDLTIRLNTGGLASAGVTDDQAAILNESKINFEIVNIGKNTLELKDSSGNNIVLTLANTIENMNKEDTDDEDEEEPEEEEVESTELTPEESEEVDRYLIEQGINPETGFTFEEEAAMRITQNSTEVNEQTPVENIPVDQAPVQ